FHEEAVLDTLFDATGGAILTHDRKGPEMTYYHGPHGNQFVFSGFSLWDYNHDDCQQLVDFVIHDLWGLQRSGGTPRPTRTVAPPPARSVAPAQRTNPARVRSNAARN